MEVLETYFEFGGNVFSHCFCLYKYSEQILSFKELFFSHSFCLCKYSEQMLSLKELFFSSFLFVDVLGTDIISFFLFVDELGTDSEFQGEKNSLFFC